MFIGDINVNGVKREKSNGENAIKGYSNKRMILRRENMISLWTVILNGVLIGLVIGLINFIIKMYYDKKTKSEYNEHLSRIEGKK